MDILTIDDKNFVKASKIAKDLGYTSDYVGQLCRGNKVEAKLVGRTWYVEQDSINTHKENRYKKDPASTPQATKESSPSEVHPVVLKKVPDTPEKSPIKKARFLEHTDKTPVATSYKTDESELIPGEKKEITVKTGNLEVDLADASSVSITSKSNKYDFSTPAREKLTFSGSVEVNDIPDIHPVELPEDPEPEEIAEPVEGIENIPFVKKTINSKKGVRPHVRGIGRKGALQRNPKLGTLMVPKTDAGEAQVSVNRFLLTVTTVVAVFATMMLLGLETHVASTGDIVTTSYTFTIEKLLAAVYGAK